MATDEFDAGDERATRSRPGSTEQFNRAGQRPEPVRRDWRSSVRANATARPIGSRPRPQSMVSWLQRGGWQIGAGIFAVLVMVALLLILFRPAKTDTSTTNVPLQPAIRATALPAVQPVQPAAQPSPIVGAQPVRLQVSGTDTDGLFLRAAASSDSEILKTLPEGTPLTVIGPDQAAGAITWKRVRDQDGTEGWVSGAFVKPAE